MNTRYKLISDLIGLLDQYEDQSGEDKLDLLSFTLWLNEYLDTPKSKSIEDKTNTKVTDSTQVLGFDYKMEAKISTLLTSLFKYAKHYTKQALDNTPLVTLDDFGFLASLGYCESMTKTELSNHNLLEITSGNEIIKRLLKNQLIEEYDDPDDRRSKRVKITEKGKILLLSTFSRMDLVSHIVAGNLNTNEKIQLLSVLNKLDDFHRIIHDNDWKSDIVLLVEKYLDDNSSGDEHRT